MSKAGQFGRYDLVERLAQGGMAEVFLAQTGGASGFQKELVIKRILPEFSGDPQFVRMFVDEARIAAQLHHPNIVQVFDFDEVDGTYFIAMEYVEGCDLRSIMEESANHNDALDVAEALYVAMEVAKALDYAHRRKARGKPLNIVHRDVSPHNVLVSFEAAVKLTDFGIAKAQSRVTRTQDGIVKGKISYMSPEQARGKRLDGRSDLFSLGTLLFELLTLRRLFFADSDREILRKVMAADVPSPRSFRRDVPNDVERIVMKLLSRRADRRYQTAAEVLDDLSRAFHDHAEGSAELVLRERLVRLFPDRLVQVTPGDMPSVDQGSWPPNPDWPGRTGTPVLPATHGVGERPDETPPPRRDRRRGAGPPPLPGSERTPSRPRPLTEATPPPQAADAPVGSEPGGSDPARQAPAAETRLHDPRVRQRPRRGQSRRRFDRQQVVKGEPGAKDEAFFEKGTLLYDGKRDDKRTSSSLKPKRSISVGSALLIALLLIGVGTLVGVLFALTRTDATEGQPSDPAEVTSSGSPDGAAADTADGGQGGAGNDSDTGGATTPTIEGTVIIRTVPAGAQVTVNGQPLPGVTPLAVSVPLGRPMTLAVALDGFAGESLEVELEQAERPVERLIRLREVSE